MTSPLGCTNSRVSDVAVGVDVFVGVALGVGVLVGVTVGVGMRLAAAVNAGVNVDSRGLLTGVLVVAVTVQTGSPLCAGAGRSDLHAASNKQSPHTIKALLNGKALILRPLSWQR